MPICTRRTATTFHNQKSVTATATTVISAENGTFPRLITSNSTANSDDSKISLWLATAKSICLNLADCENDLNDLLFEKGKAVINLSTTCLLRRDNCKKEISIVANQSPFVIKSSIVENSLSSTYSLPQLAHISGGSISSSSEESVQGKAKIFVATPITMSTTLSEISNKSNNINQSNSNKFQLKISPPPPSPPPSPPPPPSHDYLNLQLSSSLMSNKFTNHSKILQSIFLRTSTPLYEAHSKENIPSIQNGFFSSPFVQSKSFKELETNSFCGQPIFRSLDNRKSIFFNSGLLSNDKRIYLSLYNLTCSEHFGDKSSSSDTKNPANIFFSDSKSHGSLRETDLDSGLEISHKLYKETNLDKYYQLNKCTYKTSSLNNLYNLKPNQNLAICNDLDENILNKCIRSGSVSKSSRSLYSRLCENAKTPAQLRVAKSITKLNIPTWLSSVEFMQKEQTHFKLIDNLRTPEIRRNPKSKLFGIAKTIQTINVCKRSQNIKDRLNISLPSKKYSTTEPKLQPIICSKARNILMNSKNKNHNIMRKPSNIEVDIQKKLNELYDSFLSQFKDFGKSFNEIKNVPKKFENRDSKFCSRISCSKLISKVNSYYAFCNECFGIYCCDICRMEDFPQHLSICIQNVLKQWLMDLINNLFENQISILSEISMIGLENFGLGFVVWTIEKSQSNNFLSKLLIYSLASDAQEMGIILDEERIHKLEFLFVISLICESKNRPLIVSKYLPFNSNSKLIKELLKNPRVNKINKVVNSNREERQTLFDAIDTLLHYFNIDIQEVYPAFYFHLVEYVTKGCWFSPQNIFVIDPRSNSKIKIVIVPDQMPLQIPIE